MSAADVFELVVQSIGFGSATIADGSTVSKQVLSFMNEAGNDIARRAEWSEMFRTEVFAAGLEEATLPADFYQVAETGAFRADGPKGFYLPFRRVIAPEKWEFLAVRPSRQPHYHLAEGKILFAPDTGADGVKMRYVSKFWVNQDKAAITQGADTIRFPEHLLHRNTVWRWRRQKGFSYQDLLSEYEADLEEAITANRGAG